MDDEELPEATGEFDWMFDYVMSLFKSPVWDLTVMGVIDDNCFLFTNEEENKFEYTEVHEMFRLTVEQLITQHLAELGVPDEMFVEACEKEREAREINQEVYDQILAMDDFLTFKKLMVKRNYALELEAVQELHKDGTPLIAPANDEEAAMFFQRALKEEGDLEPSQVKALASELEADFEAQAKDEPKEGQELHAQILEAMDANLMEMELLHKREEMEQMELEQAIAMSLLLEEERLRMAKLEAKGGLGDVSEAKPLGELPPMKKKPVLSTIQRDANLPSLEELQKQMDSKRKQAQEAFKRNQEMLQQQQKARVELRSQAGVTEQDMERRAQHLKEQRDRILAKKKAEREARLQEEMEAEAIKKRQMAEEIAKAAPELVASAGEETEGKEDSAEERRKLMRIALARRMKQDLLENEEERLSKMQAEQFNELDRKLRVVEQLREENRMKEEQLNRAIQRQQQMRAKNVQRSAVRAQFGDDFAFSENV